VKLFEEGSLRLRPAYPLGVGSAGIREEVYLFMITIEEGSLRLVQLIP
jgi:hypothetical protein